MREHLVAAHLIADGDVERHDAVVRRDDGVLHLHRLDRDDAVAGAHGRAVGDVHGDDGAGHRRAQLRVGGGGLAIAPGEAQLHRLAARERPQAWWSRRRRAPTAARRPPRRTVAPSAALARAIHRAGLAPAETSGPSSASRRRRSRPSRGLEPLRPPDAAAEPSAPPRPRSPTARSPPGPSAEKPHRGRNPPRRAMSRRGRWFLAAQRYAAAACSAAVDGGAAANGGIRSMRPVSRSPATTAGSASSVAQERDVGVDAEHDGVGERGVESRERLGAVGAVRDHLRDHRVVVGGDDRAGLDRGIRAHVVGGPARRSTSPVAGRKPRSGLSA